MKNKLPETDAEVKALDLATNLYGRDFLRFKYTGVEVVEMMAMMYKIGCEDATKVVQNG
jgi:hypothetical protein